MKITKQRLKQIIKEEMEQVTQEQERKRLDEGVDVYTAIEATQQTLQWLQLNLPENYTLQYAIGGAVAGATFGGIKFAEKVDAMHNFLKQIGKTKEAAKEAAKELKAAKAAEEEHERKKEEANPEWQAAEKEVSDFINVGSQQPSTKPPRQQQVKRPRQQLTKER
jgi:phosphoserine aminotransferase